MVHNVRPLFLVKIGEIVYVCSNLVVGLNYQFINIFPEICNSHISSTISYDLGCKYTISTVIRNVTL